MSLDPNVRPAVDPDQDIWRTRVTQFAASADLLKISREDLDTLYPGADPETKATDWLDAGVHAVVVTDGGRIVTGWTAGGHVVRVTPPPTTIAVTVGAGDSFQAALLTRLAENGNPKASLMALDGSRLTELLTFAATAAALTCSRRGADLPYRRELMTR